LASKAFFATSLFREVAREQRLGLLPKGFFIDVGAKILCAET